MRITLDILVCLAAFTLVSCATQPSAGQRVFADLTKPADELIIRTSTTGPGKKFSFNHVICDISTPATLKRWREAFVLLSDDYEKNFILWTRVTENCDCVGDYEFTFMAHGSPLIQFTLHHMHHIRTDAIYSGHDAALSIQSSTALNQLLAQFENK